MGNDSAWGIDRQIQNWGVWQAGCDRTCCLRATIRWCAGLAGTARLWRNPEELQPALERCLKLERPALITVHVQRQVSPARPVCDQSVEEPYAGGVLEGVVGRFVSRYARWAGFGGKLSSELSLSVVDQSPVRKGGTARDALTETIELARAVERLGYQRFWVAEHHNLANFAGTSPEILIGQIAANTQSIRVGSGGVMLPHYSAFKVAEVFRMLETLFPGQDRPGHRARAGERPDYRGCAVVSASSAGCAALPHSRARHA